MFKKKLLKKSLFSKLKLIKLNNSSLNFDNLCAEKSNDDYISLIAPYLSYYYQK